MRILLPSSIMNEQAKEKAKQREDFTKVLIILTFLLICSCFGRYDFMRRGISFEIPNEYGSLLGEVLKPIVITTFNWRIGSGESYMVVDEQLDKELFSEDRDVIKSAELKNLLETNKYYIIPADLQAFPKGEIPHIGTFEEFIERNCELVLLVVDCSCVTIYCKNQKAIELLHKNAIDCGFEDVENITDKNDSRTRLSVW